MRDFWFRWHECIITEGFPLLSIVGWLAAIIVLSTTGHWAFAALSAFMFVWGAVLGFVQWVVAGALRGYW